MASTSVNDAFFKYMHQTPTFCGSGSGTGRSNMVSINKNEFIMAADTDHDNDFEEVDEYRSNGIYKYNIKENEWKLYISYPKGFKTHYQSIQYDKTTKTVYLYGDESNLVIISKSNNNNGNKNQYKFTILKSKYLGQRPAILFIQNQLNIIGGSDNKSHLIWNCQQNKFDKIHTFSDWTKGIHGHGVVHLKRKKQVLLFGGYDYGSSRTHNTIWRYSYDIQSKYEIDTFRKWEKLNTKLEHANYKFGYVVTRDEKWVILFSGYMSYDGKAYIYLIDVGGKDGEEMKMYRSSVMAPCYGNYEAICVGGLDGDIFVVNGYVNGFRKEFDVNVPCEIVGLLEGFYCEEEIHLVNKEDHVRIKVGDLLNAEMTLV